MCCPATHAQGLSAHSVYTHGEIEALRHKWIESERAQRDLGEAAMRQWVKDHWWDFVRARWLEHMEGSRFWQELDRGDFGLLKREFREHPLLVDRILDRLKDGQENLCVIQWSLCSNLPMGKVLEILEALDINRCRLVHRFDP